MSENQNDRNCSNCRKIIPCHWLRQMIQIQQQWDQENKEHIKFPFNPLFLARTCEEYESPLDVIKLAEQSKEIATQ